MSVTYGIEGFYKNRSTGKREWQIWQRNLPDLKTAESYLRSANKLASNRMDGGFSKARIVKITVEVVE
jgi:hypothetical protein